MKRKRRRKTYKELSVYVKTIDNVVKKLEIVERLQLLRKQFVRITKQDIQLVQELIESCGMTYINAPYEADDLCAYLCISGKADACLSEDTDMFVYGCPYVIRYINLLSETVWEYSYEKILNSLKVSDEIFKHLCILSGTDYNPKRKHCHINIFHYYKQLFYFHNSKFSNLFEYFCKNEEDLKLCNSIYNIYNNIKSSQYNCDQYNTLVVQNNAGNLSNIKKLLKTEQFYFV